ncbi:alpha/beta fold hydrolase [Kribbella sp. NPDC048915]|uniref:alpha/beta fold hydrolase n=1 Tax=Kribbella sp. NPDC048915 TaxID=3155148 RepID=UPI0033F7A998
MPAASERPVVAPVFDEKIPATAPAALPKYAVVVTGDHAIAPALEQYMAERAHAKITVAKGASHLVALSQPDTVTRVIEQAAR